MKKLSDKQFSFYDDFQHHKDYDCPDGWLIERHSAFSHNHAYVMNGAFALMLPGNKHIPQTPPMDDFTLKVACHGDAYFNALTGLVIYFRYDSESRRGYYLHCQWGADGMAAVFGTYSGGLYRPLQSRVTPKAFKDTSRSFKLQLVGSDNRFELSCGNIAFDAFQDEEKMFESGRIAFDTSAAAGATPGHVSALGKHLFLDSVRIESSRNYHVREIWPQIRVEFPPDINGMQKPFVYEIAAREIGGCNVLKFRLTGGSTNQPSGFPSGFYRCNEELTRPYIRLETSAGVELGPYYLVAGTVGLRKSKDMKNFMFFPADTECPVEGEFRLAELPADARLFVGYEFYQHEAAPHRRGGPTEAWVDPESGRICYVGAPLRSGCRIPEIQSAKEKEICRQLPKEDPRHEQALAFANANHYFMENETCFFESSIRLRHVSFKQGEWAMSARLENAFREPMRAELHCEWKPAKDALSGELMQKLGVETLAAQIRIENKLPVGVYHLSVRWSEGNRVAAEKRIAFEVMSSGPDGLPAPLASGLPEIHSFPVCCSGLTTNSFDPWVGTAVDASHYMTGAYYHPEFARRRRVWATLHCYRRQFQWQARYSCAKEYKETTSPLCREMLMVSDLVWVSPLGMKGRNDLWKRLEYTGNLLKVFRRFVDEQVPDKDEQKILTETEAPGGALTQRAFRTLLDRHWKAWLAYFCVYADGEYRRVQDFVKELNPSASQFFGALYPVYASNYKGMYFPFCIGFDLTKAPNENQGPAFLEDYPMLCRYNMHRGAYQLVSMKLVAPQLKIFVEMYGWCATPVDGLLLAGNPPYSRFDPPLPYFRKRLFEFACAAVWFGKDGFAYWKDYGFHARFWSNEQYGVLLSTWSIIRRAQPLKPLRSTAFASSMRLCWNHPDYYEPEKPGGYPWGDVFNTAEECTAYAYEKARVNGQLAGFLLELESLAKLDPADVDTLVLPPLTGASKDMLAAIRAKHEKGVNLLGFEDVTGLEDLFGVAPMPEPAAINLICINPECAAKGPWRELAGLRESCDHPLCRAKYKTKNAMTILDGMDTAGKSVGPVLVTNQTRWGRTALFCIPPTIVNRADLREMVQYGQECLSQLMNRATALVLKMLGSPAVETTDGKIIGFRDVHGNVRVIVMEDAWPEPPRRIDPRVTVHLPGVRREAIKCDRPFSILDMTTEHVSVRLSLDPHDSAVITIEPAAGRIIPPHAGKKLAAFQPRQTEPGWSPLVSFPLK